MDSKGGIPVKVLIDADGCPVVDITIRLCNSSGLPCLLLCDTAHSFTREGAETLTFDKGADSVDFAIANRVEPLDVVITQDYGLASMCLAKRAVVLHQDGWQYTDANIQALLFTRHETKKYRNAGGRVRGPSKRTKAQDDAFLLALESLLQQMLQG